MERAEWTGTDDDTPLVGIVGATENLDSAAIDRTVSDHDATIVAGSLEETLEQSPSVLVCVGQSALGAVARADASVPVLPVDAGDGVHSVPAAQLPAVVDAVLAGAGLERHQSTLRVETDSETLVGDARGPHRAFFDVALVTEEPARISEYSVTSRGKRLAQFRADGVVVATPQGSHGYASAAGGPLLSNGLDAVAVVPIAPFVTQTRQWIVPHDGLELAIERDEGPVTLQVDDRSLGTVAAGSSVSITTADPLSMLVSDGEWAELESGSAD
ncbi:NAD(+)/NADH kinase [Natronoglomus mannanivorans]|uniref:NAD(+)/NADH kinase n=1 Tax=Natronoglomus mannanivorans TaxID=2979990 RepID=A0AAP2YZ40_9EURY|nr:NAD(+)/NADH kinase [Halobacteria archaeon AArc-xg1-1]